MSCIPETFEGFTGNLTCVDNKTYIPCNTKERYICDTYTGQGRAECLAGIVVGGNVSKKDAFCRCTVSYWWFSSYNMFKLSLKSFQT